MESVPKSAQNAGEIGWAFVPQYYNFVNKDPSRLHCFYTKQSTLTHGTEGEEVQPCFGQQDIHAKFMSLGFDDCKVFVNSVDAQPSASGGIIVQVIGEMSNNGPWRRFSQTFFLAEQPNGYFVLNDIFRYLKDDVEEGTDAEAQTVPTTNDVAVAEAPAPPAQAPPVTVQDATFTQVDTTPVVPQASAEAAHNSDPASEPPAPAASAEPSVAPKINGFHDEPAPSRQAPPEVPGVTPVPGEKSEVGKGTEAVPAAAPAAPAASAASVPADAPPSAAPAPTPAVETKPDAPIPTVQEANASTSEPTAPAPAAEPAHQPPAASTSTAASTPAPAPAKVEPPAPKTWASLAASGKSKWSGAALSASQGVSSAPPPTASRPAALADRSNQSIAPSSSADRSAAEVGRGETGPRPRRTADPDRYPPIESINSGSCFIKGVNENVDGKVLHQTLERMFGPVKELDIVRSKACAFLEFDRVDSARNAIQMSMPFSFGGQGGIPVGPDDHIINIETKKQPGERGRLPDAGPKRGFGGEGRGRGGSTGGEGRERYGERVAGSGSGRGRGTDGDKERGGTRGRGRGGAGRGAAK